jgi:hypothetical protein
VISAISNHRKRGLCAAPAAVLMVCFLGPLQAQVPEVIPPPLTPNTVTGGFATFTGYLRAQASPDECWIGLGENLRWNFPPCTSTQIGKADQGYIWGATLYNDILYFGTDANPDCIGQGFTAAQLGEILKKGYLTNTWACEFGQSPYSVDSWTNDQFGTALPDDLADFRPPRFYAYNIQTHVIKDITPKLGGSNASWCANPGPGGNAGGGTPLCIDSYWVAMEGVHSVAETNSTWSDGTTHNLILVSGPGFVSTGLANTYFALDVTNVTSPTQITNSNWVAKYRPTAYADQRHWLTYNGAMYAPTTLASLSGGAVLQYTGNFKAIPTVSPGPGNGYNAIPICGTTDQHAPPQGNYVCFAFQEVGLLPNGTGTDIALHTETNNNGVSDTRIYVATWPPPGPAGLYMSPPIPATICLQPVASPCGFAQATPPSPVPSWQEVWNYQKNYDPDPVVASTVGMGALTEFNGELYFGTMVYPMDGTFSWLGTYDPQHNLSQANLEAAIVSTFRSATLFRGTGFTTGNPTIQLLYGQAKFPVWNGTPGATTGSWVLTNNNMTPAGTAPLYGYSGFGNVYNNYIWTMANFNNKLYVGTMNWGYPAADAGVLIFQQSWGQTKIFLNTIIPPSTYGAALFSFTNNTSAATGESTNGLGNYLNYGIRTLIPNGTTSLLLGTANPMDLATIPGQPQGGWALIEAIPGSTTKSR